MLASPVETEKFQPSPWTAQFPLVSFVRQRQGKVMYWNNSTSIWQKATISYHITSVQPHDKFPKFCFVVSFGVARLNSCGRELLRQNILSQHCKELWQTGTQAASLVESVITSCNTSLLIFHNMITSLEMVSVRHVYKFIYHIHIFMSKTISTGIPIQCRLQSSSLEPKSQHTEFSALKQKKTRWP